MFLWTYLSFYVRCHSSCTECSGAGPKNCTVCGQDKVYTIFILFLLLNTNLISSIYIFIYLFINFINLSIYLSIHQSINVSIYLSMKILEEGYCTGCEPGYYLTLTEHSPQCVQCDSTCGTCSGPARSQCTDCTGTVCLKCCMVYNYKVHKCKGNILYQRERM